MKIAIIGAGPRGLLVAEQIKTRISAAKLKIFDPFSIGGQTWQTTQNAKLIMNTPIEQVQQFVSSPNLFEWSQKQAATFIEQQPQINDDLLNDLDHLTHNGYATRRLYGAYLKFCFQSIPNYEQIQLVTDPIESIKASHHQWVLTYHHQIEKFDQVIITINNGQNQLNKQQKQFKSDAKRFDLNYFPPRVQVDSEDFTSVPAKSNVIIRGLGLTFYDLMVLFTEGRGGQFYRDDQNVLQYLPSGKEPRLIIGSGRGLPHYPRPQNQDGPISIRPAKFLTISNIKYQVRKFKLSNYEAFLKLIRLEIEFKYDQNLIQQRDLPIDLENFQKQMVQTQTVPADFPRHLQINWDQIVNPVPFNSSSPLKNYHEQILDWFQSITQEANRGSQDSILMAGLNVIRSLYNDVRAIYTDPSISDDEFKIQFIQKFVGPYTFLISGPPSLRLEQLAALIRANMIDLLPPQMQVSIEHHNFIASSKLAPQHAFSADTLIDAYQPHLDIQNSANPLVHQMVKDGFLSKRILQSDHQSLQLKGANINLKNQVINQRNQPFENLFLFSQLTNGLRWLVNVCPRSGEDDNRHTAQQIVDEIIKSSL